MSTSTTELPRSSSGLLVWLLGLGRTRLLRSLGRGLLVGFGVMIIAFGLIRLIPGDPVRLLLGDSATEEAVERYRQNLGLNGSLPEQFIGYVGQLARGDLGTSIVTNVSVNKTIERSLPVTLWLIGVTVVIAVVISLPLAVAAALHRRGWFGHLFRILASVSLATPVFYSGLLLLLFFAIQWRVAPVAGYKPDFPENLAYLWLPALTLCGVTIPILARVLQSSIIDTLEQEFVETAIVRGLAPTILIWRYLLRPSLAPMISLLGYMIGQMLGAAVIVEIVFNLPGIGTALIAEGVLQRDYTMVQGIVLVTGFIVVAVSFFSDTLSGWLDPRTRVV